MPLKHVSAPYPRTSIKPLVLQFDFGHSNSDVVTRPLIIKISEHSHRNDKCRDNCYCERFHQGILRFELFSTASPDPYHARPDGWAAPATPMHCGRGELRLLLRCQSPTSLRHLVVAVPVELLDLTFKALVLTV